MTTKEQERVKSDQFDSDVDDALRLNKDMEIALSRVERIAAKVSIVDYETLGGAIQLAKAMRELRTLLSDAVMKDVMSLMNSSLGFKTDRDPTKTQGANPYSTNIVRDCFIESLIRGLRPVGNEWNIIAGNCYTTKEGLRRLVHEWPGISNIQFTPEVPRIQEGGALFGVRVAWELDGVPQVLRLTKTDEADSRIPIKVNKGQGSDAILGKGERKTWQRVYDRLCGRKTVESPLDDAYEPTEVSEPQDDEFDDDKPLGDDPLFGKCMSESEVAAALKEVKKHVKSQEENDDLVMRAGNRILELEG